jgi:predicted small secreted protein
MMRTILIIFFLLSSLNLANAACNFKIKLGEDIKKIKNNTDTFNIRDTFMLKKYSISSLNVCPNIIKDENIIMNYTFIDDKLAQIRVVVNNDENNTTSNQLLLMNYVKQTYGNFDTGTNPKIYNYFKSWKRNNKIIVYSRLRNQFNIIYEELFITNKEYKEKMSAIRLMIEKGEHKKK